MTHTAEARAADRPAPSTASPSQHARWFTGRSVMISTAAVVLVCGLAPYNDFVVANTTLIGSNLPVILLLLFFVLTVLVNAPLLRWAPRHALGTGEIMLAALIACSIPTTGLMRVLLPGLAAPFHMGSPNHSSPCSSA